MTVGRSARAAKHFVLSGAEATALIELVAALEPCGLKNKLISSAVDKMDEQMAGQLREWEHCSACDGSGWVEDGA